MGSQVHSANHIDDMRLHTQSIQAPLERVTMDFWASLQKSPIAWVAATNILEYARRQASSCRYLERQFERILISIDDKRVLPPVEELFGYLTVVHQRQFRDLSAALDLGVLENRNSFYFETLYQRLGIDPHYNHLDDRQLSLLLAAHAVSYLRGHDRYKLLKEYNGEMNRELKDVWAHFFEDAIGNSRQVISIMGRLAPFDQVRSHLESAIFEEQKMIQSIWNHNGIL